jgi:Flp pilus assembly protein TadD
MNLGNVYMQTGRFDDALNALESARDRDPDAPEIHNSLGAVHFQRGDYERAAASFERALALNPDYAKARQNLAAAQARLRRQ